MLYLFLQLGPHTLGKPLWSGQVSYRPFCLQLILSQRCRTCEHISHECWKAFYSIIWWKNSSKVQPSDHSRHPRTLCLASSPSDPPFHPLKKLVILCLPTFPVLSVLDLLTTPHYSGLSLHLILQGWSWPLRLMYLCLGLWDLWVYASSPFQPVSQGPGILFTLQPIPQA